MTSGNFKAFPLSVRLWQGAVLATIANAIFRAVDDSFVGGRTWNGSHYWLNDDQGAFGVVGFRDSMALRDWRIVALLCDSNTDRSGWEPGTHPPDWRPRLAGMPADLRAWAERDLLDYMRQVPLEDGSGTLAPLITAAFWSDGDRLAANEPWSEVLKYGAHVLSTELMEFDEAVEELQGDYLLFPDQVELLVSLYERKMADPSTPVVVQREGLEVLFADGDRGLETTRDLLQAIGIILPPLPPDWSERPHRFPRIILPGSTVNDR